MSVLNNHLLRDGTNEVALSSWILLRVYCSTDTAPISATKEGMEGERRIHTGRPVCIVPPTASSAPRGNRTALFKQCNVELQTCHVSIKDGAGDPLY